MGSSGAHDCIFASSEEENTTSLEEKRDLPKIKKKSWKIFM